MCDKNVERARLIKLRAGLADRAAMSEKIAKNALPLVYGNVMVYISVGTEVDTSPLIEILSDKPDIALFAPYTNGGIITPRKIVCVGKPDKWGNMSERCYGYDISTKIDVCITPLLGFNGKLFRIGYGKGCYDRFFAEHKCKKIGLAFSVQKTDFVQEKHDVPLDCCVTEKDVIYS